jgi:hypothetical protein
MMLVSNHFSGQFYLILLNWTARRERRHSTAVRGCRRMRTTLANLTAA